MNFSTWEPIYKQIIADFSFSEIEDQQSACVLNSLLKNHQGYISFSDLKPIIYKKKVVVVGASSHVQDQIIIYKNLIDTSVCISADGATSALINHNLIPDIVVTDLDGTINDQLQANSKGSIIVIHAHGNNIETIQDVIPRITGKVTGTIQTNPSLLPFVSNIGGFTDGDRGVFLATHFNAASIILIGFDFHGPIGLYSNPHNKDIKMKHKKLIWAERLITLLNKNHQIEIVDSSDEHGRP